MQSTDPPSSATSAILADYQSFESSGATIADSSDNFAAAVKCFDVSGPKNGQS